MKAWNKTTLALLFAVGGFVWMYFFQNTGPMYFGLAFIAVGSGIVISNWF